MLKKVNRGLSRKDFENSREKGRLIHGSCFSVSMMDRGGNGIPPVQVGFVISKKISKRAVDRNRIKRLITEVIKRDVERGLGGNGIPPVHLFFLVRKNILEAKIEEIEKCWNSVYEQIGRKWDSARTKNEKDNS